mgnify:CR=1 FL=1
MTVADRQLYGASNQRADDRAERGREEDDGFHYSPSLFSGARSIGSASSISLVKIRS